MKKRNFLLFLLANLALSLQTTRADNDSFNVQFIGTIVGESCNVDTGSVEQTVELGDFTADNFPSVGTTTPVAPAPLPAPKFGLPGMWMRTTRHCWHFQITERERLAGWQRASALSYWIPIAPQYRSIIRSPRFIRRCRGITRSRFICTINPRCPL